jgi:hypothetical protein
MIGIPVCRMRGQGRVGSGFQLVAELRFLVGRDRQRSARCLVGGEIAGRLVAVNPPGDAALADLKQMHDRAAGHALGVRRDHALA